MQIPLAEPRVEEGVELRQLGLLLGELDAVRLLAEPHPPPLLGQLEDAGGVGQHLGGEVVDVVAR